MLYLVLRFNIRLCESHNHTHTVDITLYYTVFPMPHVEEANKIIVIVIVIVIIEYEGVTKISTLKKRKLKELLTICIL